MEALHPEQRAALLRFYASVGYSAPLDAGDEIFLSVRDGQIVGAVRLCREEGTLVLRGMYVDQRSRGEGIGRALLGALERRLVELSEACYCLPYARLERFYGSSRFVRIEPASAPEFLIGRLRSYMARGTDAFIVMKRA